MSGSGLGVSASPRVVTSGPVPKGGGREMVGKPYTVGGRVYTPRHDPDYSAEGLASWYGSNFHGRLTANGEVFDRGSIAAAHPTMPLPSYARITNVANGHSMIVRVNDRGPFHSNRVIDVSERAADALGFKRSGTARVQVDYVGRASTNGSDDRILLASLRTDGAPASLNNGGRPTMIASATPRPVPERTIAQTPAPTSRSYEASASVEVADTEELPVAVGNARSTANAPLPPERPFDLGTIPGAATPVRTSQVVKPNRPVVAGLYYAEPPVVSPGFSRNAEPTTFDQSKFIKATARN
jgi:rare lipoprotein A